MLTETHHVHKHHTTEDIALALTTLTAVVME